jgi:two-component system, NarL family, invasion response regulator UvrY
MNHDLTLNKTRASVVKLLLVDDHAIVREGLKRILANEPGMLVSGEAGDSFEALQLVRAEHFDVVLLDISLPGKNGLDVLKLIKTEKPHTRVLILSMFPEDQYAVRVLKAGAAGYLAKESAPKELINAIRKVADGGTYVSPSLGERLAGELAQPSGALHETLSDREFAVLRMIASGRSPTQIADEMQLSIKTISTYRSRILVKMNLQNNSELTHYALKNNIVT